jgi:hypothetical protein
MMMKDNDEGWSGVDLHIELVVVSSGSGVDALIDVRGRGSGCGGGSGSG